ncbi:MAG: hypothetical protein ABR518_05880, partial [Actinomycetota bacterium]
GGGKTRPRLGGAAVHGRVQCVRLRRQRVWSDDERVNRDWQQETDRLLSYARERGIGWTFWAYSGGNSLVENRTGEPKPGLLPALQRGF